MHQALGVGCDLEGQALASPPLWVSVKFTSHDNVLGIYEEEETQLPEQGEKVVRGCFQGEVMVSRGLKDSRGWPGEKMERLLGGRGGTVQGGGREQGREEVGVHVGSP